MSYPAHVTDTVYRYDGTFQGFLCCIFESYSRKEIPAAVCAPDRGQISFYDSCEIVTDPARAQRVARGLERLGPTVKERITTGFLSDDPEHELILLRFARICFEKGPAAARATGEYLRTWDTNSLTVKRMTFQVRRVLRTWKSGTPHPGQRSYKIKLVNSYIVPLN